MAVSETKLKGEGEVMFGGYKGVISGVSEKVRAREGVGIVISDKWWRYVKKIKRINARLMWVRLRFGGESWVFVSAYGPVNGSREEDVRVFWEKLGECLGGFGSGERVCLLGDLNARVGSNMVGEVVGPWGVGEMNRNGDEMVSVCVERGMCVGNTWFKKRDIHKYTWVSGMNGERALIDYVCVRVVDRKRLIDVNVLRGVTGGVSDPKFLNSYNQSLSLSHFAPQI